MLTYPSHTVLLKPPNSKMPLSAISFCEVLATSDVPGGVVNVLTGSIDELLPTLASHMDVNALSLATVSNMPKVFEAQELAISLGYTFWKGDDQLTFIRNKYERILLEH